MTFYEDIQRVREDDPRIKDKLLWQACLGAAAVGVVIYLWWIGVTQ